MWQFHSKIVFKLVFQKTFKFSNVYEPKEKFGLKFTLARYPNTNIYLKAPDSGLWPGLASL